ncbi:Type IV secretory pathway, component VirB8 precursor [Sphingobium yanoikuyae]|uniref:Type IV secretory pathway, component VirB8 n=1 Tax=Sphingobium yanoikuyae TaxID=13690 RepID=A0A084EG07_SPHYA|nr:VirB8/TrbF family protein [Sphingobium yanoikuyae]KEZ16899.1 Type IV secretory pathway, component VirB8 precursor [Sphingobium yanoikuyae]
MNEQADKRLADYYRDADSWAADRERTRANSLRTAWIVAACAGIIAFAEAIALVLLTPLKTVEPYTLLVDRQTGYVQALKPLQKEIIAPDTALTRSLLAQYVLAREGFDIVSLRDDYRKVALWSTGDARARYIAEQQASNPHSRLATLPRRAVIQPEIRSLSSLGADTALVRFSTVRIDPGGQSQPPQYWASVVRYRFSSADMSARDRLTNPLGFQIVHYRRDAEIPAAATPTTVAPPSPTAITSGFLAPGLPPRPSTSLPTLAPRQAPATGLHIPVIPPQGALRAAPTTPAANPE